MSDSDEQRRALYPVNYLRHVPRYAPIIWALARELATLYLQAPSRRWKRLDGGDLRPGTVTMLQQAYDRLGVNIAMREHQRHIVALNNATLWVQPHPRTGMAQLVNVPIHDQDVELGSPYAREEDDAAVWRYLVPIPMKGFPAPMAIPATAYITPTLASGDVKISKDDGAFANLATLPTVAPASGVAVQVELTGTEMNADKVVITFIDQTVPKEWADWSICILTTQ